MCICEGEVQGDLANGIRDIGNERIIEGYEEEVPLPAIVLDLEVREAPVMKPGYGILLPVGDARGRDIR